MFGLPLWFSRSQGTDSLGKDRGVHGVWLVSSVFAGDGFIPATAVNVNVRDVPLEPHEKIHSATAGAHLRSAKEVI